jgi:hypothetical protein
VIYPLSPSSNTNSHIHIATYYQTSVRRFRRNVRDDIQREVIKNNMNTDFESMDWLNTFLGKTLSPAGDPTDCPK